jgi:tRNA(Met) cytidine acetyltransferase
MSRPAAQTDLSRMPPLVRALGDRARRARHRLTLVLSGSRAWTAAAVQTATASLGRPSSPYRPVWLTDRDIGPLGEGREPAGALVLPLTSGTSLTGSETDLLVYDAWSGLDADGLAAATGALRGGGLFLLLTPPLDAWPDWVDPQAARIAVWPRDPSTLARRFQRRFARILAEHPGVTLVREGNPMPEPPMPGPPALGTPAQGFREPDPAKPATPDQRMAIDAILRLARGRPHRPLVLTAHRGRGKSSALGIAAGRLVQEGMERILVTAPRFGACRALFRHFNLARGAPTGTGADSGRLDRAPRFVAPDDLRETHPETDLLLVDEAAGIPAPMLGTLLAHYPRICFATTVHGYEGTGRGFELRFRDTLDRQTPGWCARSLTTPIRWSPDDPLEALIFRLLLLDAAPAGIPPSHEATAGPAELVRLDRDLLIGDEQTLEQVFGLLILAHYQTRPLDLRMLLDGPNVRVYALRQGGRVLATLLAAEEGDMGSDALRRAIFTGRRRPRGHLLPQTLSAHGGLGEAPALRYLRVIRIAVHPGLTRRGLGARLLRRLALDGRREGFDLAGASFGATPGLIAFWGACGYRPAQMGTSRNAASGEHAVVMLKALSLAGRRLAIRAEARLEQRLGVLLAGPLRALDPGVAAALVAALGELAPDLAGPPASADWDDPRPEIDAFVQGHRTLQAALPVLCELVRRRLGPALRRGTIDPGEAALLIAATRQLRPVNALVKLAAAPGRAALIEQLRGLVGRIAGP